MDLREYTKLHSVKLRKYRKYLKETDWTEDKAILYDKDKPIPYKKLLDKRITEYQVQDKIISTALERLKILVKRYIAFKRESPYKTFINLTKGMIEFHLKRCAIYENYYDILDITDSDYRSAEVEFQNTIFKKTSQLQDELNILNLSTDDDELVIEFLNDVKAPLPMHTVLVRQFPDIQKKLDQKKIDFKSEPEPKMFIHDKNPPEWDPNRHYFDQDSKVLQYYVDEWKKIQNGLKIDGVYISGWMYYHINYFFTKYPQAKFNPKTEQIESADVEGTPPLRDNEWWIINDNYEKAKKEGKMMFIAATRRAAKTTMEASHIGWSVICGKRQLVLAGGSKKDLGVLQDNIVLAQKGVHIAFRVPFLAEDWERVVDIGLKNKSNKSIILSYFKVINMDGGMSSKSEIFAGLTPDAVVIDEVMKLPFKSQLAGLLPALDSPGGKRCVVILSGTAGSEELAKDAFDYLRDPETNQVLSMPWDILNKRVSNDYITWKERPFGTFIPAQMSAKDGLKKLDNNLSDFLGIESDFLRSIDIKTTDWKEAKRIIEEDRAKKKKDLVSYTKEVLYYPMCPSDMLLSTNINPFPVQEAISHREYLKSKGGVGRKGFLHQSRNGEIQFELSENPLAEYPFKGGNVDAPIQLFEPLPTETPPDYLYLSSLDDYKQDEAGTDSIGSFYIYKVDVGMDKMCGKIVASYASRPEKHEKFHNQIYLLQQAFNAKCLMENADMSYKDYLERRRVADKWLEKALDFEADLSRQSEGRRKYGVAPTPKNKNTMLGMLKHYTERTIQTEDEEGYEIDVLGVQMIDDIVLLDEIISYSKGANVDRITSFMHALAYESYLNANYMLFNANRMIEKRREEVRKEVKRGNTPFFSKSRTRFF